jgi:signal transduction histidine kinase
VNSARGTVGRAPRGARLILLAGVAVALAVIVIDSIAQWATVSRPCEPGSCTQPQLTDAAAGSLSTVGLDLGGYATVTLLFSVANAVAAVCLAVFVGLRAERPAATTVPYVFLVIAVLPGAAFGPLPPVNWLLRLAGTIGLFWLLATFPRARFQRSTAIPVVVAAAWAVVAALPPIQSAVDHGRQPWTTLYGVVFALAILAVVALQAVRFRRGSADERRRLRLVVVILALLVAVGTAWSVFAGANPDMAGIGTLPGALAFEISALIVLLLLAAIGVSVVRDGAYGVKGVVNRVLAGAIALALAVGVYAGTVALASAALAASGWVPQALGTVVTALVLGGLLGRISRWIDRLVFGIAQDPTALVQELVRLLPEAQTPAQLLAEMGELIRVRLRLPALSVDGAGPTSLVLGSPPAGPGTEIQLGAPGAPLGLLRAWPRPGQRNLTGRDLRALTAAARVLAVAATAARLTRELDRSRARVRTSRAEERAAVSRQLHDELAPTLAVARHRVNAAQRDAGSAPESAAAHLAAAERSLADATLQVRTLSRSLRPPDLAGAGGLVAAVERFAADRDIPMILTVSLDDWLGSDRSTGDPSTGDSSTGDRSAGYRAGGGHGVDDVELAAFRILSEALTNVARHAGASRTEVAITASSTTLHLTVSDDGRGPAGSAPGVGLASMRERATELGGYLTFGPRTGGGSTLRCELPLAGRTQPGASADRRLTTAPVVSAYPVVSVEQSR